MQVEPTPRDPLRRFTQTPFASDLRVMGRTLRLETNSLRILEQTRRVFERYGRSPAGQVEFLWKIVSEENPGVSPPWPQLVAFSEAGLRYVNLGQRCFLAVDLESREAVGLLSEGLARDELGFGCIFLATLFGMTAGAFRLTAFSAGCVALGGNGLLVFGPPLSGKTTATYLAGKLGLEFHADQATFLDLENGALRAWGQFWPAAFRADTDRFLPEIRGVTHPVTYLNMTLSYLSESPLHTPKVHTVTPASCIFLERQAAETPRLIPISSRELSERFEEGRPFYDDERFEPARGAICRALGKLPAYRLAYGSDPAEAAHFFRSLLSAGKLLEAQG